MWTYDLGRADALDAFGLSKEAGVMSFMRRAALPLTLAAGTLGGGMAHADPKPPPVPQVQKAPQASPQANYAKNFDDTAAQEVFKRLGGKVSLQDIQARMAKQHGHPGQPHPQ